VITIPGEDYKNKLIDDTRQKKNLSGHVYWGQEKVFDEKPGTKNLVTLFLKYVCRIKHNDFGLFKKTENEAEMNANFKSKAHL
jgi:hypothetical protein